MCRLPVARAWRPFRIGEFHLPTNLLVLKTSPEGRQNLYPEKPREQSSLPGLKAPPLHLIVSGLRAWWLCALCIFPETVHSNAQRQNPHPCRSSPITPTNCYRLDRIGFGRQIPRQPNPSCASGKTAEIIAESLTRPPGSPFFQPGHGKTPSALPTHSRSIRVHPCSSVAIFIPEVDWSSFFQPGPNKAPTAPPTHSRAFACIRCARTSLADLVS